MKSSPVIREHSPVQLRKEALQPRHRIPLSETKVFALLIFWIKHHRAVLLAHLICCCYGLHRYLGFLHFSTQVDASRV